MMVGNAMWARKALAFGLVMATSATIVVLVVATKPVGAAFPGSNGKIAFHSASSIVGGDPSTTDTEIYAMKPVPEGSTNRPVNLSRNRSALAPRPEVHRVHGVP